MKREVLEKAIEITNNIKSIEHEIDKFNDIIKERVVFPKFLLSDDGLTRLIPDDMLAKIRAYIKELATEEKEWLIVKKESLEKQFEEL